MLIARDGHEIKPRSCLLECRVRRQSVAVLTSRALNKTPLPYYKASKKAAQGKRILRDLSILLDSPI